jgi:tape measure domain-containing protein
MATIGTAIKLNDMMSAPIKTITDSVENMTSAWKTLDSATKTGLNVNVEETRSELQKAVVAVDQMGDEQQEFNRHVENGANAMDGLTNQILGAVGAYVSLQSLGKLVNLSDSFTQTNARLNMINDGAQTTDELFDKIAASADRSRASISATADTVAKLSLNAGDAFSSNDETILFAENLNKLFAIAGTEQQSIASATLQLTQALGSGVLRGEEFNAVFEAAPNIMQKVADYMNVPIGQLRSMAQEGQITADIVKNALLSATNEINTQFNNMPMTWGQVWTGVMNELYYASLPLLNFINLLANNWSVLQPIVMGVATAIGLYTAALLINNGITAASAMMKSVHAAAEMMATGATFAATVAQHGFNAALMACPLTWILVAIIAIIAIIYAVIAAINKIQGTTVSATGVIFGAIASAVAFIWNSFLALVDLILACVNAIVNPWIRFANFFGNLFVDPIGAIINHFGSLADSVLGILESIAKAIDKIFGSDLAGAVSGWRGTLDAKVAGAVEKYGNGKYEDVLKELDLSAEDLGLKRWAYEDAFKGGYNLGEDIDSGIGDLFGGDLGNQYPMEDLMKGTNTLPVDNVKGNGKLDDIAGSAKSIDNSLSVTKEDLKYLRDIAEQEAINRFTTAEIRVDMGGINNTVNQNTDLDGIIDYMVTGVQEAMERVAEGVHD